MGFDVPEPEKLAIQEDPGPDETSERELDKLAKRRREFDARRQGRLALRIERPGERIGADRIGPRIPVIGKGVT